MADHPDVAQTVDRIDAHPAVVAWSRVGAGPSPTEVRVLKERSKGIRKSAVYWLRDADGRGGAVIAKLARRDAAGLETLIYSELLPGTSVDAPRFHGALEEGKGWAWVFLEHVAGERYTPQRADHRRAAGKWAGELHPAAAQSTWRERLPDRGPDHFLNWVRRGRDAMAAAAHYSAMTREEARTAEALHASLDALDQDWDEVSRTAAQLPSTLVHGDLVRKNLLVRRHRGVMGVIAFDWENAGWGAPALDLAYGDGDPEESKHFAASPCLETYRSVLGTHGLDVDPEIIVRSAAIGTALRCVSGVVWSALAPDADWVRHPMAFMAMYARRLEQAMAAAGIGGRHART
jgi:aminoglycoside phosphotransferase (APT) family kinase protein